MREQQADWPIQSRVDRLEVEDLTMSWMQAGPEQFAARYTSTSVLGAEEWCSL